MADEEVSDPKALLEERSKAKCVYQWYEYQKCVKRIEDDETGQKHCTGQYFDYWKCVDKNIIVWVLTSERDELAMKC
ncbi:hypothetical protein E2562_022748 [Oryza meyeriana var. granulata]|uniref:Cytochrome b-c1 complex subunit 6 n=1 Tax=Oryza meyeriana var. granulata TaxID=110450 RepID=A0A6G1FB73_9ORYZ|nr:hypothetical protein E2562_022748 [Oryza meyeriana var. granulata]